MPAKSKRNRRSISPMNNASLSSPAKSVFSNSISNIPGKAADQSPSNSSFKTPAAANLNFSYFYKELKWIGLTTLIIVILLIVAYIIFY